MCHNGILWIIAGASMNARTVTALEGGVVRATDPQTEYLDGMMSGMEGLEGET